MVGSDRISELPDSILTHILSYLPTKEAVRTWRLSKRWKNVWAFVSVLDFDSADFPPDHVSFDKAYASDVSDNSESDLSDLEYDVKFVNFIDAVLASRQVKLVDRFRLVWEYKDISYYLDSLSPTLRRWIHLVAQQCPRVLSILLQRQFAMVEIPDQTFTCSSLEEMKLEVHSSWPGALNPALVSLPHLRKLNLGHFHIEAAFMDKLLLGCPSLEELELYACWLSLSQISCGNLKSLVINGCFHSTEIEVLIPSLQYLKVTVISRQKAGYVFKNMSSLVKASICLLAIDYYKKNIFKSEANILAGLLGVTTLDIVLYGLGAKDMLKHIFKTCPYFENLKFMHFEIFNSCIAGCIDLVDCLVQHTPALEELTFYRCQHSPALEELTFYRCQDDAGNKIELVEELRDVLGQYGIARLVERHQGRTYGSLGELEKLLVGYMNIFETVRHEEGIDDYDEEQVVGGGVWWEDEDGGEEEASSAEGEDQEGVEGEASSAEWESQERDEGELSSAEEEEGEDEADEHVGGAMEEGEEMEKELEGEEEEEEE
ncbi:hypothetical protein LUZ62_061243 [Rhynchospora pubera]|uniref:F-box domain-containing protein n=1 Tax=Rhynchospora pubera TaxID=906938 RepID=A0AAV8ED61_9POAL|nr:hypothetical protein LUZ62_061243 [Rhynchospora pubera]